MSIIRELTPQQLRQAADLREQIMSLQDQLNQLIGASDELSAPAPVKKRRLSPEGLANIRAGVRRRWANANGGSGIRRMRPKRKGKMSANRVVPTEASQKTLKIERNGIDGIDCRNSKPTFQFRQAVFRPGRQFGPDRAGSHLSRRCPPHLLRSFNSEIMSSLGSREGR
jgi:hypothetical protein